MAQNDSAMTVFETVSDHHHHHSPGSIAKDWNVDELETCGAVGTNLHAPFDLDGEVHPIFHTWIIPTEDGSDDDNSSAIAHALHQPLILASRILESAGLPWLSEFCIDDIFSPSYPGRNAARKPGQHDEDGPSPLFEPCYETPDVIVRHHRAAWATPRLRQTWLASTAHELRTTLPRHVQWQLDADIFKTSGWVGYTCRHPHGAGKRDHPDTISAADEDAKRQGATGRLMTVLVMKEYVSRLCELRRTGRFGGEEYMLTAFMAAVTLLHELGHVIYWRDFRAVNRRMTEPYFGGDLEMELGDSFVASIFGGWVPVPISLKDHDFRNHGTFACGLAWRQHLTWDYHRARPKHRAHYSIPVT
ncbi:hypothetical protein B0T19DRAFT_236614 [Cercophora scortea]|uniref:Uncharacterized protein n=1 Tax=Cercophora scortea TaxID=314031 RepID=A0AAE0II02_9PEZI|nr:hypothetical protein B0T19DRAFT_236614 [Cercophora scortea]